MTTSRYQCLDMTCEDEAICFTCLWCPSHCPCVSSVSDCPRWDAFVLPENRAGGAKKIKKVALEHPSERDDMLGWSEEGGSDE